MRSRATVVVWLAIQVAIPAVVLAARWAGIEFTIRFGWHMFAVP